MGVTVTGIVLLIVSVIVLVVSFLLPESQEKESGLNEEAAQEEIKSLIRQEVDGIRSHVEEVVQESMTYAIEKTERSLERLSNEKIMAVSEYSDTVMQEIHKSHEEVMFLYDMLNSKHETLKKTVAEAGQTAKTLQDTAENLQRIRSVSEAVGNPVNQAAKRETFQGLTDLSAASSEAIPGSAEVRAPIFSGTVFRGTDPSRSAGTTSQGAVSAAVSEPVSRGAAVSVLSGTASPGSSGSERKAGAGAAKSGDTTRTQRGNAQKKEPANAGPLLRDVIAKRSTDSRESRFPGETAVLEQEIPSLTEDIAEVRVDAESQRNKNEQILELHGQGKSNVAIAKELGLGVGEVRLVIDLYKNR